MGWIGSNDFLAPAYSVQGRGVPPQARPHAMAPDSLLAQGTLVLEVQITSGETGDQPLIRIDRTDGWVRCLHLVYEPNGNLVLRIDQAGQKTRAHVALSPRSRDTRLRITYVWDSPARHGWLTVEDLDQALLAQSEFDNPPPLLHRDLADLCRDTARQYFAASAEMFALSDRPEPVALMPGFGAETKVTTDIGPRAVENLRRGDLVRTACGTLAPIRWITCSDVPAAGALAPVHLRAPYFGLDQDIRVAQDHMMMISGSDAEYLFGEAEVMVQARHLLGSKGARLVAGRGVMRYYHLLLDTHECIQLGGAWGESLFVGAMAGTPDLIATTPLAAMSPSALPRHRKLTRPLLREYETVSLLSAMIA